MRRAVQALGWAFLLLDAAALVFFAGWALTASSREGEQAYSIAFLLFTGAFVAIGGGGLAWARRRGSGLGVGCATLFLGTPPLIVLGIWISNLL